MPETDDIEVRPDLATLSLDAAIQLDRINQQRPCDREVLADFLKALVSFDGQPASGAGLSFAGDPLNVEIFNSALQKIQSHPAKNVEDVRRSAERFYLMMRAVSDGYEVDNVHLLRDTCLSLHRTLLNHQSPFRTEDDWILAGNEQIF